MNVLEMNEKQFSDLLDRITSGKEIKRDKNEKEYTINWVELISSALKFEQK